MATNVITAAGGENQLTGQLRTYYIRRFIEELNPKLIFNAFGVADTIPAREGRIISWPTMTNIGAGETLAEAGDGTAGSLVTSAVTATLADYGKFFRMSSYFDTATPDPVLDTLVARMARRAARDLDAATRDVLNASTNIQWAGNNVADGNIGAGDVIEKRDIDAIVNGFEEADVEPVTDFLLATGGTGTLPGEPAYIAVAHAHVINDLRKNASSVGFDDVSTYVQGNGILPGEAGKTGRLRWLNAGSAGVFVADAGTADVDVYSVQCFGADAFGVVDLAGRPAQIWAVPAGTASHGNPLGRRGSLGWTAEHAAAILTDSAVQLIHCSSSFGAN